MSKRKGFLEYLLGKNDANEQIKALLTFMLNHYKDDRIMHGMKDDGIFRDLYFERLPYEKVAGNSYLHINTLRDVYIVKYNAAAKNLIIRNPEFQGLRIFLD